jgi:Phosphotransferase system cellobiose-specific component IIB
MNILVVCNGGVSTSILAANIKKYIGPNDSILAKPYIKLLGGEVRYNPDVILIAPQIKAMKQNLQEIYHDVCIVDISKEDYGEMNGKSIYKKLKELNFKEKRGLETMKKLKITICCNGGVSTASLCKKIIQYAESIGYKLDCNAYSSMMVDQYTEGSDVILVGPQIKFQAKDIQKRHPNIPVEVIGMREYGQMNGKKIFDDLKTKYNW